MENIFPCAISSARIQTGTSLAIACTCFDVAILHLVCILYLKRGERMVLLFLSYGCMIKATDLAGPILLNSLFDRYLALHMLSLACSGNVLVAQDMLR